LLESVDGIHCRSVQELSILFSISRAIEQSFDLSGIARHVMAQLRDLLGLERGTITLFNRDTGEFMLNDAIGLPRGFAPNQYLRLIQPELERVRNSSNAFVSTKLRSLVCERAGTERADLLNLSDQTTLVCVPLKWDTEVIGALSIERGRDYRASLESDLRLLNMIATMVSQAAHVRLDAAEQMRSLREENDRLQEQIAKQFRPGNIIGTSSTMQTVYYHIEQVAHSDTTVLVRGESGTGKELVAKALHENSNRKNQPFVKFNCAALPDSIIESELFGHEKGAFTGALSMRKGRFEIAHKGTIFLDEIGDISPAVQVKLLRVLQEKEFERVGGQQPIRTNVRIIAATNRNLEEMIAQQRFREDLYYRLNVFPIYLPPLRERKCDILLLCDHFIEKYSRNNAAGNRKLPRISSAAIDLLMTYHWPGNVRELENCIERAVLLAKGQSIKAHHLPPTLQTKNAAESREHSTLDDAITALEREMIVDALKDTGSNMAEAARRLGLTERKMGLRVRKYDLDLERYKRS